MSHEYISRNQGQEGVFIDENVCEDGCIHISCDIYDEEGEMIFHTDFPIGVTPKEISEFVLFSADCVLNDTDDERDFTRSIEIAEDLKRYAKRVPGL